jgi:hypothetical protein
MKLNVTTFSILSLLVTLCINDTQNSNNQHITQRNDTQNIDTQHNDTQHNGTQHNGTQHNNIEHLSVVMLSDALLYFMLSVIMLSVVTLSVVALRVSPYDVAYAMYARPVPRAQCYKTFTSVISQSVCSGRPFQPSLMFVGKAKSLHK